MTQNNVAIAEAYYKAMGEKNIEKMGTCLHPAVKFFSPLANLTGKEAVLEAAKRATSLFKTLAIRATFGSADQAMLAIDLDFPMPMGNCPTAVLLTFQDGLISKIELFYDGRFFDKIKDAILSK